MATHPLDGREGPAVGAAAVQRARQPKLCLDVGGVEGEGLLRVALGSDVVVEGEVRCAAHADGVKET